MASSSERTRDLNNRFRARDATIPGRIVVTADVQALVDQASILDLASVMKAVAGFDGFTSDNDPHREHDFGSFEIENERLFWKIDYYAPDLQHGSDDPADIDKTVRVLTIMLANEY
jgi:hypothetical protein